MYQLSQSQQYNLDRAAIEYLKWLELKNYSKATILDRSRHLKRLGYYLNEIDIYDIRDIKPHHLQGYQRYLYLKVDTNGKSLSYKTQAQRLIGVRTFFKWLKSSQLLNYDLSIFIELPRTDKTLPSNILSTSQIEQILQIPDINTPIGLRDKTIMEVLWITLIRRNELCSVMVKDVDFYRKSLYIKKGKGGKDRYLPLNEPLTRLISEYLQQSRPALIKLVDVPNLFVNSKGRPIHPEQLSRIIRRYVSKVTDKPGSCHCFRHSGATALVDNGADIRHVGELLGHENLETTKIYTKVSIEKLKSVLEQYHPSQNKLI